jgi:penicillin amidase
VRQVLARLQQPDASFGPDPVAGRDTLLSEALAAGLDKLRLRQGQDVRDWEWGKLHHVRFDHELAEWLPEAVRRRLGTARFAVGGDDDTVHRGTFRGSDHRVTSGASFRQVIDLSDWDRSGVQNVPGQSADPDSPFYRNLLGNWAGGAYSPMAFSPAAVRREGHDTLLLEPKPSRH